MSKIYVDEIRHSGGAVAAMQFDSTGLVSLPNSVYLSRFGLTSNLTSDGDLTAWAVPTLSNQVATINTAVTVSSGVFTFPVTGVWRVHLNARVIAVNDTTLAIDQAVSTDGGSSFTDDYVFASEGGPSGTFTGSIVLTDYLNVDNVSNIKLKFAASSIVSGGYVQGQAVASGLRTWVSFERITDSQ